MGAARSPSPRGLGRTTAAMMLTGGRGLVRAPVLVLVLVLVCGHLLLLPTAAAARVLSSADVSEGSPCVVKYPGWSMKPDEGDWSKKLSDVDDVDECLSACGPAEGFTGVVHSDEKGTCYCWKGQAGKDWKWEQSDSTSYVMSACGGGDDDDDSSSSDGDDGDPNHTCDLPKAYPAEFQFKGQWTCKDATLTTVRELDNLFQCQQECACRSECKAVSYNADRGDCYLKTTCSKGEFDEDDATLFKQAQQSSYTYYSNFQCGDYTFQTLWGKTQAECEQACDSAGPCQAWSFKSWGKCELKYACNDLKYDTTYVSAISKDMQPGGGYVAPSPPPPPPPPAFSWNPSPVQSPGCIPGSNLPFGLDNCVCDGAEVGGAVGLAVCSSLATQCNVFGVSSFTTALEAVQQVCDALSNIACLTAAQQKAASLPGCVSILSQPKTGSCTGGQALQFFQAEAERLCEPLCPSC